jgi:hypothetical protein
LMMKRYLNSDGQQYHQDEHSSLTITHWTQKTTTCEFERGHDNI